MLGPCLCNIKFLRFTSTDGDTSILDCLFKYTSSRSQNLFCCPGNRCTDMFYERSHLIRHLIFTPSVVPQFLFILCPHTMARAQRGLPTLKCYYKYLMNTNLSHAHLWVDIKRGCNITLEKENPQLIAIFLFFYPTFIAVLVFDKRKGNKLILGCLRC